MDIRQTIIEFNIAFELADVKTITKYITDDFEWHMLGESTVIGKDSFIQFFADHKDTKVLSTTKDHIIIDGDFVSVDGEVQCTDKSGKIFDMYYCDVYEFKSGLIKKMISYMVTKKKE